LDVLNQSGTSVFSANVPNNNGGVQFATELVVLKDLENLLIVWSDNSGALDTVGYGVYARIFSTASLTFVTDPFLINQDMSGDEVAKGGPDEGNNYALTALNDGGFAVFWFDSGIGDIQGRLFNGATQSFSARTDEFIANSTTAGAQHFVHSTLLPSGNIFLTYCSVGGDGTTSIFGKEYTPFGAVAREEFVIGTTTEPNARPRVTAVSGTDVFVTWHNGVSVVDLSGQHIVVESVSLLDQPLFNYGTTGNDVLSGQLGIDKIFGNDGDDQIFGFESNDYLEGGIGNDILDGGIGADRLTGGAGNDTYYVDSSGDIVTENLNEGIDLIFANASITMRANIENLTQLGTASIAATGNTLDNVIRGNSGNNALNGGAGNDTLIGGLGNDTYTVDSAGDVVTEASASTAGTDLVNSFISYTLGTGLEYLTLLGTADIDGTGNVLVNRINGNAGVNTLRGEGGNDTLNGLTGADTLIGGTGSDIYVVNDAAAVIVELASQGTDTVQTSVSYTLAANVERLSLQGPGAIDGTGNNLANVMAGNNANNTLNGMAGNDTLTGGLGADRFVFARGSIDTVTDFAISVDKIVVSAADFGGGLIAGGAVVLQAGSTAVASGPGGQFLYDTDDGRLWFDADGQGGAGPTYFARLRNAPSISAADFEVIA
jgi:Ca2+-binding RTX toxin-like protein